MQRISLIILSIFLFAILTSCSSSPPDLTENEVYSIINEIAAEDSLYLNVICWEFESIAVTSEMSSEFTPDDLEFIASQKAKFDNTKIKPDKIHWVHRRTGQVFPARLDSTCDDGIVYHISFPLISVDRQKVIIEFEEDCSCMLGGHGGKYLFEKKNGHWQRIKGFDTWISDYSRKEQQPLIADLPHASSPQGRSVSISECNFQFTAPKPSMLLINFGSSRI